MRAEAVVVGAGPAGLAMGQALSRKGVDHVILERDRIGSTWRTQRWDAFRLNTPGYMNHLLGDVAPDSFATGPQVVALLEDLAEDLPVREQAAVSSLDRRGDDYVLQTGDEEIRAANVVIAAGGLNVPQLPDASRSTTERVEQRHAATYRNAAQLPPGAVLVVGGAQSGCQIAEDLAAAGRRVYLSTCRVGRYHWRYRGRDTMEWLLDAGYWSQHRRDLEDPAVMRLPQPVIASGGRDLSLQLLERAGVTLLGRLQAVRGEDFSFDDSAAANVEYADQWAVRVRELIDAFIERSGRDAPPAEPDRAGGSVQLNGSRTLNLDEEGITSVIWCTGFAGDYSWVRVPVLDAAGQPDHQDGATVDPGVWFVGLPWLARRDSGILNGFPADADRIAAALTSRASGTKGA